MFINRLDTAKDSFWGLSETQMHTLLLRYGVIISEREFAEEISHAKAAFFAYNAPKYTENSVVNIMIAQRRGTLKSVFA